MKPKEFFGLLKDSAREWIADEAPVQAAALAYYTVFSIAPLLIVLIAILSMVYGEEAVRGELVGQFSGLMGENGAQLIQDMIRGARRQGSGILATIIGIVILIVGATGVFAQLQRALNKMWDIKPGAKGGIMHILMVRLLSFGMILVVGFLLLVSFVLSAALSALSSHFSNVLPGNDILWWIANTVLNLGVITLLFALIFRYLPDEDIPWSDVRIGAAATAVLFVVGKYLIDLYLTQASPASAYGAAGSLVILLLWVYYSAQIVLFGAEFTQVYARRFGSKAEPQNTKAAPA